MSKRIRALGVVAGFMVLFLVTIDGRIGAQEPAAAKPVDPAIKKRRDPIRRVPTHFGQIGLTTEQRASIYSIQNKRLEKIEALEQQIAVEKSEMLAQCEAALTETQKKLLENLRRAATESTSTKTADASKPSK